MIRVITIVIFLIGSCTIYGQSYDKSYLHHDFMISYGLPSTDVFQNINSTMLDEKFPDLRYTRDDYNGTGIISLTYRYVTKNEIMFFGVSGSYNKTKGNIYNVGELEGELNRNFITLAIEGQYRYQNMNKVQLYSGIGIGYTFGNETLTTPASSGNKTITGNINSIAWQINAIGIRVGKSIAGFAEFGYGYKGIVNLGLSIQLY
jgi:hypothetical protein